MKLKALNQEGFNELLGSWHVEQGNFFSEFVL